MVAVQVMGNHVTVTMAGVQGHQERNVFKPVIIQNVLQSCRIMSDCVVSFATHMVDKLAPNCDRIAGNLAKSLMLVTALNPRIGYDKAVKNGKLALAENITLQQAAEQLGFGRPQDFNRRVAPAEMTVPRATLPGGGG